MFEALAPTDESEPFGHVVNVSAALARSQSMFLLHTFNLLSDCRCVGGQILGKEQKSGASTYEHGESCSEHDDTHCLQGLVS